MSDGSSSGDERVSATEAIATLSLATDLSIGFDFEHGLRSTLVAVRLAERLDDERWDGKGPTKVKGEDTPLAMRIAASVLLL